MNTKDETLKLKKQIEERENFITACLKCISEVFEKIGETTQHEVLAFHTKSKKEVKNFHGFSFFGNFGHSEMGGNDIKVLFGEKPVMNIYCQFMGFDIKDCTVTFFSPDTDWQTPLQHVSNNKDMYLAAYLKTVKNKKIHTEKKVSETRNLQALKLEAQRLGL